MKMEMVDYTPQLTKIIQINSGKADYVEIEPRNSTHLAADNGEGKSSILNALQFLMIDDWSRMKFPKDNNDTGMFYFPGENSHIIFEIRDELNHYHQVWFSGRTSAVKDRYQRIVLNGKYSKEIFVDENEGRWLALSYNDILANCSARGITVEPFKNSTDLRNYLSEKINWYPVAPDFQKRFFTIMRKLNQLSDMTPNDLKEVLIEVAQIKSTTLDFEVEFRGIWSKLEHEGKVIDELRKKQDELEKLGKNLQREKEMQSQIVDEIRSIAKAINGKEEGEKAETSEIKHKIESLKLEIAADEQLLKENEAKRQQNDREFGSLQKEVAQLKVVKAWVDGLTEEELVSAKDKANTRFMELNERYQRHNKHSQSEVSLTEVERNIEYYQNQIDQLASKLKGMEDSVYSKFGELGINPDPRYWTKFNPDLLLTKGKITSESELTNEIKRLNNSNEIALPGITIEPQNLTDLEQYTNPEALRRKFGEAETNLKKYKQLKEDITNFEQLKKKFDEAERILKATYADLKKYEDWFAKGASDLEQFEIDLAKFEASLAQIDKEHQVLIDKTQANKKIRGDLISKITAYQAELESCMSDWENVLADYLGGNIPTERTNFALEQLKRDIKTCKDRIYDLERVKQEVLKSRMNLSQLAVYLALDLGSEEFVTRALERYDTIDIDEENLTNSWMNLQGSIVQKANLLREGIVAVRRELNSINGRFKKTNVSNLELFEVKLIDNSSELKMFDSLSQLGGFAKFTRTEKEIKALETFKFEVSKRNKFYLSRLFDLQFVIKNPGEESKEIKRLDFVGSTGTQTVVKTVLLFLLLSKFTKSNRKITKIPVQVDEVGTLGPSNYSEILGVANALNFQIFTASPKSVAAADIVYPLLKGSRKGRLFCDISSGRPKTQKMHTEEE